MLFFLLLTLSRTLSQTIGQAATTPAGSGSVTTISSSGTTISSGSCCPVGGTWGPWSVSNPLYSSSSCTDTCGACGTVTRTRICESLANGCPCTGSSSQSIHCNTQPCKYPRQSCCNGLKAMPYGNSSIICGPEPQFYDIQPIVTGCISSGCCPPQGVWSQWSSSTSCNGTCGGCGVQTKSRICMTEANGCPCIGPTTMSAPCAFGPCIYPNNSCCAPFSAMVDANKNVVCGPQPAEPSPGPLSCDAASCPPGGIWSAWTSQTCSDTCGMCGTGTYTRTCQSASSCPCTGPTNKTDACGASVCPFPRPTCCPGYSLNAANSQFLCLSTNSSTSTPGTGSTLAANQTTISGTPATQTPASNLNPSSTTAAATTVHVARK